jgi:hypothetical protein
LTGTAVVTINADMRVGTRRRVDLALECRQSVRRSVALASPDQAAWRRGVGDVRPLRAGLRRSVSSPSKQPHMRVLAWLLLTACALPLRVAASASVHARSASPCTARPSRAHRSDKRRRRSGDRCSRRCAPRARSGCDRPVSRRGIKNVS